jgi:hypothetical protein
MPRWLRARPAVFPRRPQTNSVRESRIALARHDRSETAPDEAQASRGRATGGPAARIRVQSSSDGLVCFSPCD